MLRVSEQPLQAMTTCSHCRRADGCRGIRSERATRRRSSCPVARLEVTVDSILCKRTTPHLVRKAAYGLTRRGAVTTQSDRVQRKRCRSHRTAALAQSCGSRVQCAAVRGKRRTAQGSTTPSSASWVRFEVRTRRMCGTKTGHAGERVTAVRAYPTSVPPSSVCDRHERARAKLSGRSPHQAPSRTVPRPLPCLPPSPRLSNRPDPAPPRPPLRSEASPTVHPPAIRTSSCGRAHRRGKLLGKPCRCSGPSQRRLHSARGATEKKSAWQRMRIGMVGREWQSSPVAVAKPPRNKVRGGGSRQAQEHAFGGLRVGSHRCPWDKHGRGMRIASQSRRRARIPIDPSRHDRACYHQWELRRPGDRWLRCWERCWGEAAHGTVTGGMRKTHRDHEIR